MEQRLQRGFTLIILAALALALWAPVAGAQSYVAQYVGVGSSYTSCWNSPGGLVGISSASPTGTLNVTFTGISGWWPYCDFLGAGLVALPLPGTYPKGHASGISPNGRFIAGSGTLRTGIAAWTAGFWVWDRGAYRYQNLSGKAQARALDVNDLGQVVGATQQGAVVWQNGKTYLLPAPGGSWWPHAHAINNLGGIVGTAGGRALLWEGFLDPEPEDLYAGEALDINDGGVVVGGWGRGWVSLPVGAGRVASELPLPTTAPLYQDAEIPANSSSAFAVNAAGIIVGDAGYYTYQDPANWQHAMIWLADPVSGEYVATDLNDLVLGLEGYVLYSARAINDQGQIVCFAYQGEEFIGSASPDHIIVLSPLS